MLKVLRTDPPFCGHVWRTLEAASKEKGFSDEQILLFEEELNKKLMCKSV
jgi:hypothetical protein